MKTEVRGWENEDGTGQSVILCDSSTPVQKQIAEFEKAKRQHIYPKGIKRVSHCRIEELEIAIQVSPDLAKAISDQEEARKKKAAEEFAKREAEKKASAELSAAQEAVQNAAKKRNELLARKASLDALKRNAQAADDTAKAKELQDELNALGPQIEKAVAAYEEAKNVLEHHKTPKKPEQPPAKSETKKSETKKETK